LQTPPGGAFSVACLSFKTAVIGADAYFIIFRLSSEWVL
jgi:hypothetical protein